MPSSSTLSVQCGCRYKHIGSLSWGVLVLCSGKNECHRELGSTSVQCSWWLVSGGKDGMIDKVDCGDDGAALFGI